MQGVGVIGRRVVWTCGIGSRDLKEVRGRSWPVLGGGCQRPRAHRCKVSEGWSTGAMIQEQLAGQCGWREMSEMKSRGA